MAIRRVVNHYHWNARPNFGDRIAPLLMERFAGVRTQWSQQPYADVVSVGSIIDILPADYSGHIFGSGKLRGAHVPIPSNATVWGLRGPLTAAGRKGEYFLGDPGLLACELVQVETKKYNLGLVPHWSDQDLAKNPEFLKYNPIIIDPAGDPLEVIRLIGECRKIVASSLHGLIVADSFGIPRRFEYTKQFNHEGGMFKFRDYSAAIGAEFEPGKLIRASTFKINDRRHAIYDAYRDLGKTMRIL